MQGTIQTYFDERGFGFILVGGKDRRYFHIRNFQGNEIPFPGLRVEFDLAPSKRGGLPDQAVRVHAIPRVAVQS